MYDVQSYVEVSEQIWDQKIFLVAVTAWLAWDIIVNLSDEVTYVWRGRGALIKVLYVFARYAPAVHQGATFIRHTQQQHSTTFCRAWNAYTWSFMELHILVVELILILRVFALYRTNDILSKIICFVFGSEIITMTSLVAYSIPRQIYTPQCLPVYSPSIFSTYWVVSLLFESFLWGLTTLKFIRSGVRHLPGQGRRSYIRLIMRDGTWVFALIFITMLAGLLTLYLSDRFTSVVTYHLVIGILSLSGSHVILNIRRLSNTSVSEDGPSDVNLILDSVHIPSAEALCMSSV